MADKLDWRVAIIGYDPIRWVEYLDRYARQPGEPTRLMDDGRRETHFAQHIDDMSLRRSFYQALLQMESAPVHGPNAVTSELGLSVQKRKSDAEKARPIMLKILNRRGQSAEAKEWGTAVGGIHAAAVAEVAESALTSVALKQRVHPA